MPGLVPGRRLMARLLLAAGACVLGAAGDGADAVFRPCGMINHGQKPLGCHEAVETDCTTMRHLTRLCPYSCPFVAPHPELSCVFECASAASCSSTNAEFAFPNNRTYVCEPCNVVGCRRCSSPDRCLECFDNFWLELGGRVCAYVWEDRAKTGVHAIAALAVVLVILTSFIVIILDHCRCCGRCLPQEVQKIEELEEEVENAQEDDADERDENCGEDIGASLVEPYHRIPQAGSGDLSPASEPDPTNRALIDRALTAGGRHRLRCKIKDLEVPMQYLCEATNGHRNGAMPSSLGGPRPLSRCKRVPMWVDLQSRFLVGVGLPLFHQWFYFLFLYSAMMCAGTAWVYYGSDLSSVLQTYGLDHARKVMLGRDTMAFCEMRDSQDDIGAAVRAFAYRCTIGYLALWVLGLGISLAHAARQKRIAATFHHKHPCLAEFGLNIEGFPPEATDEAKIRGFLREAFGSEALEVSVCYDYRSRRKRVHELLEKVLVLEDVLAGTYESPLAADGDWGVAGLGLSEEDKAEVCGWLRPGAPGGLRNAGSVFAVLPHNYDLQLARQKFDDGCGNPRRSHSALSHPPRRRAQRRGSRPPLLPHSATPEWLPPVDGGTLKWVSDDGRISNLVIRDVVCEPPDVVWDFLGLATSSLACRSVLSGLAIAVSFVAMAVVVFMPLAQYSIAYMDQAGSFPTGVMMTVVGTLQMTANWVICLLHCFVSSRVGFARRDREGLMIFKVFAVFCLASFLFNVTLAIFPESSAHGGDPLSYFLQPLDSRRAIDSIKEIAFHVRASVHLFHVLVPGTLFIGYLVWPLQGFVWPLVSTFTFLRCWHRRSYTPNLTARQAEWALEPLGLSIGHDSMGNVVQPACCTLVLFFASGVAWQVFGFMALWSVFMSQFMRYLHLRAVRRIYHTTNRLDTEVLFAWGFPLSMVLAASCFWGARLWGWPLHVVPISWACGNAVYAGLLAFWIRPLSPPKEQGHACHRPNYDEVRSRRFYDWHNCNPIKVLLSHCHPELGPPITPFEIGKEYLQANDPRWRARLRKIVTSRDMLLSGDSPGAMGLVNIIQNLQVPEVETFIQRPMECILGLLGSTAQQRGGSREAERRQTLVPTARRKATATAADSKVLAADDALSADAGTCAVRPAGNGHADGGSADTTEGAFAHRGASTLLLPATTAFGGGQPLLIEDDGEPADRGHGRYL